MLICAHLYVTLWTAFHQAPLEFFRPEYWSWLPFPNPEHLLNPGIKSVSLASPALANGFFSTGHLESPIILCYTYRIYIFIIHNVLYMCNYINFLISYKQDMLFTFMYKYEKHYIETLKDIWIFYYFVQLNRSSHFKEVIISTSLLLSLAFANY